MTFSYFQLNRGRYLCSVHGGFCDETDGWAKSCPLCKENDAAVYTVNEVARALTTLNGLQDRSAKAGTVIQALTLALLAAGVFISDILQSPPLVISFVVLGLLSTFAYVASMQHFAIKDLSPDEPFNKFCYRDVLAKTIENLRWAQRWHATGRTCFLLLLLIIAVSSYFSSPSIIKKKPDVPNGNVSVCLAVVGC
ncbi:hypothetical protein [Paracoccus sphaerophysae]|uniref:hypothetical protein n=1 Tax=Paracoccus sphaerophysae TaxID=690417 RepID=UPI002353911E|nr:hypothetical protein [Paracoccus sphaerophysae]